MIPAMNRQQRRMMEKQQARVRATRRPDRPARLPMLIKTQQTLAPLESIIDQIDRDGTVTTDDRGVPIFHCVADGEWYASAPAILGMADFFDMWAVRHGHVFKAVALRQLAKRLGVGMPIDMPLMAALRAARYPPCAGSAPASTRPTLPTCCSKPESSPKWTPRAPKEPDHDHHPPRRLEAGTD